MNATKQLAAWIQESSRIVFRRSRNFNGKRNSRLSFGCGTVPDGAALPLSSGGTVKPTFFDQHADIFMTLPGKMLHPDAEPNGCHRLLAKLEQKGKLHAIITQNIDGLHQKAGSSHVLELHGSVHRNACMDCKQFYSLLDIMNSKEVVPVAPHAEVWSSLTSSCTKKNWIRQRCIMPSMPCLQQIYCS